MIIKYWIVDDGLGLGQVQGELSAGDQVERDNPLQSNRVLDYSCRQITLEESFDAYQNGTYPDALPDLLIRSLL